MCGGQTLLAVSGQGGPQSFGDTSHCRSASDGSPAHAVSPSSRTILASTSASGRGSDGHASLAWRGRLENLNTFISWHLSRADFQTGSCTGIQTDLTKMCGHGALCDGGFRAGSRTEGGVSGEMGNSAPPRPCGHRHFEETTDG